MRRLGNALHIVWVGFVVFWFLIAYGLVRLGLLIGLCWSGARRRRVVARWNGWALRTLLELLGASFIKMGQVMSTRPDLFAAETIAQLKHLQDRLPAFAFAKVRRIVEEDTGKPLADTYAEFDEAPVAAASVAQVHRARLRDGREVAVKVLRPNVRRQVERDASLLMLGAKIIALHPRLKRSDPVGHTQHFVDAIHDQTDLRIEATNYRRFHDNFASWTTVKFPEVLAPSTERVLTMEFIRGTKIDAQPDERKLPLAEVVRRCMFQMCFDDGFLHADMHPGNMLVDDPETLDAIFREARTLVITHCEDTPTIDRNLAAEKARGVPLDATRHPYIRSTEACVKSTKLAMELARRHDTRLHILHVSTGAETDLFEKKPLREKRITAETCVHFLHFDSRDYPRLGNLIKCNPAVKFPDDRDRIIAALVCASVRPARVCARPTREEPNLTARRSKSRTHLAT